MEQKLSSTEASNLSSTEAIAVVAIAHSLDWEAVKLLLVWLDCIPCYQSPNSRNMDKDLAYLIVDSNLGESKAGIRHDVYKAWRTMDIIETILSTVQQKKVLSWLMN